MSDASEEQINLEETESIRDRSEEVKLSYMICADLFFKISKIPTRDEIAELRKAYNNHDDHFDRHLDYLETKGIDYKDCYITNKWPWKYYLHESNGTPQYICPSFTMGRIEVALEKMEREQNPVSDG